METDLAQPSLLPLIPERLARQHDAFISTDSRFKAAARLLASLWRSDRSLAAGSFVDGNKRRHRIGSLLTHADGRDGRNFIDDAVRRLAWFETHYREPGAAFDVDRFRRNLLSSQTLIFNAFGPLKLDLDVAKAVFSELMPDLIAEVENILFEHSPGRGDPRFTNDYTALDLVARCRTTSGARLLIGVEGKYTETCWERIPRIDPRHDEIATQSGIFIDPRHPALRDNPIQQLYRLTCLMQSMLDAGHADEALLLFVAPSLNTSAQKAAETFRSHVSASGTGRVAFDTITLERLFEAIALAGRPDHFNALYGRYGDWHQIVGEVELYADEILPKTDMKLLPSPSAETAP